MSFTPINENEEKMTSGFHPLDDSFTAVSPENFKNARSSLSWSGNILENIRNGESKRNLDAALGAVTGLGSFGAQNAGPVGADMLSKTSPEFQAAMKPDPKNLNQDQSYGLGMERVAELGVGLPKSAAGAVRGTPILAEFFSKRAADKATRYLQATGETMTKSERAAAALEPGRVTKTFTGAAKYNPSATDMRAGKILSGKVKANPIDNIPEIQKEIASRGKEAEQFLGMNARPIGPDEIDELFKKVDTSYLTKSQLNEYERTIGQFHDEVRKLIGTNDKIAHNTGTYYKALKNFEQNVTEKLPRGQEALLNEQGAAKLEGARTVRNVVRDLIGNKNPEFKEKMYDLASLYDALDNTVSKADQLGNVFQRFHAQHPAISNGLGAGILGSGAAWAWNRLKN